MAVFLCYPGLFRPGGQVQNFAISPWLVYDPWEFGERLAFYNSFREGDRRQSSQAKTLFHQANLTYLRVSQEKIPQAKILANFGRVTESRIDKIESRSVTSKAWTDTYTRPTPSLAPRGLPGCRCELCIDYNRIKRTIGPFPIGR